MKSSLPGMEKGNSVIYSWILPCIAFQWPTGWGMLTEPSGMGGVFRPQMENNEVRIIN
jgi:hypothetical protein